MNIDQILCAPFEWTEKIYPCSADKEYPHLRSYFHGRVIEVFCRGGRWGQYLLSNGHIWSGMDVDAQILELAFLRGLFSVSVGLLPLKDSCDMIFAPMAPFSMIAHDACDSFIKGIHEALSSKGTVLFALWEQPDVQIDTPLMYTYNGQEKLVMACSVEVSGHIATLDMEWMVVKETHEPYFVQHTEKRILHHAEDLRRQFAIYFSDVEILTIVGRQWLFAKKT